MDNFDLRKFLTENKVNLDEAASFGLPTHLANYNMAPSIKDDSDSTAFRDVSLLSFGKEAENDIYLVIAHNQVKHQGELFKLNSSEVDSKTFGAKNPDQALVAVFDTEESAGDHLAKLVSSGEFVSRLFPSFAIGKILAGKSQKVEILDAQYKAL